MIFTTLYSPFSVLYVCGGMALVVIPAAIASSLAVYLTTDVDPGEVGIADKTAAATATTLVGLYFILLAYMFCWRNVESYFSTFPWKEASESSKEVVGKRAYQVRCPFTGLRPSFRCPSCQCRIHEDAFHPSGKLTLLAAGETILRWEIAKAATEAGALATDKTELAKSRGALDEGLDYRGNVYTQAVSGCCVGCATWQKCFNLATRQSLSLALASVFFAYVPWAFSSFLVLLETGGTVIKIISGSLSVSLAAAALLVQIRALGRVNSFLAKHSDAVPALRSLWIVANSGFKARLTRVLFATPWDPLM